MKKIFALLIIVATLFSCDKTESPLFDGARSLVYFEQASLALPVDVNAGGEQTRLITTTTLSDMDRTVEIDFVSSTLLDEDEEVINNFTFTETVTIPAGEYSGEFVVSAEAVEELTTSNELLVFNIASTSFGADMNGNLQQLEVAMRLTCPVPEERYEESDWLATSTVCTGDGSGGCDQTGIVFEDYAITITPGDSEDEFEISDITGGLYALGYGSADNPVIVSEACNDLIVNDAPDVVYGGDVFNASGFITVDDEGELVEFFLDWSNGWGDAGQTTFVRAN